MFCSTREVEKYREEKKYSFSTSSRRGEGLFALLLVLFDLINLLLVAAAYVQKSFREEGSKNVRSKGRKNALYCSTNYSNKTRRKSQSSAQRKKERMVWKEKGNLAGRQQKESRHKNPSLQDLFPVLPPKRGVIARRHTARSIFDPPGRIVAERRKRKKEGGGGSS